MLSSRVHTILRNGGITEQPREGTPVLNPSIRVQSVEAPDLLLSLVLRAKNRLGGDESLQRGVSGVEQIRAKDDVDLVAWAVPFAHDAELRTRACRRAPGQLPECSMRRSPRHGRSLVRTLSAASKLPRKIAQYVDDLERVYRDVTGRR
jgi:hypothetical protein